MVIRIMLALLGSLASSLAFAAACHVSQSATSAQVPTVVLESCYEFSGVPAEAINWSCSNESNQPLGSDKHPVAACKSGFKATCSAPLSQESLANHRATGDDQAASSFSVPENAQVITYFYSLENQPQAKIDCELGGGKWKEL